MKELFFVNFYVNLNGEDYIDDTLLQGYIEQCGFGDTPEEQFLYFLTQIGQKQSVDVDFDSTYSQMYDLIDRASKLIMGGGLYLRYPIVINVNDFFCHRHKG